MRKLVTLNMNLKLLKYWNQHLTQCIILINILSACYLFTRKKCAYVNLDSLISAVVLSKFQVQWN